MNTRLLHRLRTQFNGAYRPGTACFLLALSAWAGAMAQQGNLVPNPGFERYKTLPTDVGQGKQCLDTWVFANVHGGGEYYHAGAPSKKANTFKNGFGSQEPRSGDAYAGICVAKNLREFLQVRLMRPLVAGRQYTISVFISCGDKVYLSKVDEFGLLFSQKSFNINLDDVLLRPPQVTFQQPEKYANKAEWQQLSTVYTADGTEHWMTFGSFPYEVNGQAHGEIHGAAHYAHYYIDDVSIVPVSPTRPSPPLEPKAPGDAKSEYVAGATYVFKHLHFASGKSVILPESFAELDRLQHHLREHPDIQLTITGHTDNVGDPASNLQLSHDRAEAVMYYLLQQEGIDRGRITIAGKGDQLPLTSNETEAGREENRRVEFSLR